MLQKATLVVCLVVLALGTTTTALAANDPFSGSARPSSGKKKRSGKARRKKPASRTTKATAANRADADSEADSDDDEEEAPRQERRRAVANPLAGAVSESDADEDDDEDDEDRPRVRRSSKHHYDDDDEDDDDDELPMSSLPSIVPRLASIGVGASLMGRSFKYNTPLQHESAFPRTGVRVDVEAFPLIRLHKGWFSKFGLGFNFEREVGRAAVAQSNGSTISYPVTQGRWSLDLRFAIPLGSRVVLVPAFGYGLSTFDLGRNVPVNPSGCTNASTEACLADVPAAYLIADMDIRIAFNPSWALSFKAGYLPGMGVGRAMGQLGAESPATLVGYHVELGLAMSVLDWLTLRLDVPYRHLGYTFGGGTVSYTAASEDYYGVVLGLVAATQ